MTNEQINAAIAEACGWTDIHESGPWHNHKLWGYPPELHGQSGNTYKYVPDYCNDLNAMQQAISILNKDQFVDFIWELMSLEHEPMLSTARQRAEAFLRTLGKWEEEEEV